MRNPKLRTVLSIATVAFGTMLPATAQMRNAAVLLKVAVPTTIAGYTLQPGSYELSQSSQPNVLTIQKTGTHQTSMFVLPTAVADSNHFAQATPKIESRTSPSGEPVITAIYFPTQDRAYYFSSKIEERSPVSHPQQASASTPAQ